MNFIPIYSPISYSQAPVNRKSFELSKAIIFIPQLNFLMQVLITQYVIYCRYNYYAKGHEKILDV